MLSCSLVIRISVTKFIGNSFLYIDHQGICINIGAKMCAEGLCQMAFLKNTFEKSFGRLVNRLLIIYYCIVCGKVPAV